MVWQCASSVRARAQIAESCARVAVAICFSFFAPFHRSRTGEKRRHHIAEGLLQSALKRAVDAAGIVKRANCHSFTPLIRHIFAVERIRYPNRAGASRTQGRRYDDDLHARAQQTGRRSKESFGLRSDRKHRTLNIESRITPGRRRGRRGAAGRRRERRLAWAVFRAPVFGWVTRQRRVAD